MGSRVRSELDVVREGIEFSRNYFGKVTAKGPPGVSLKEDVAERVPIIREWRLRGSPPQGKYGTCDSCGLAIPHYRAGNCTLCCCAIQKLQKEEGDEYKYVAPAAAQEQK